MDVVGKPNVATGSLTWVLTTGRRFATIIAKTTYRLVPGESELCAVAEPLAVQNQYVGGDPTRELAVATDLNPHKARADVLVVGSAYSPAGPTTSVVARIAIGPIDKSIEVFGDRVFLQDGSLTEPNKLTRMPLGYDRAAGGPDTWNPVGVRSDLPDHRGRCVLPNFQPPGLYVTDRTTSIPPIGFGPLSPRWPTRWTLWTLKGEPNASRFRDEALVEHVDKSFFNAAPRDQQLDAIRPGDHLLLENLSPTHPILVTALPSASVRAVVLATAQEIPMIGDTLLIDTDRQTCSVTWRGQIEVSEGEPIVVSVSIDSACGETTLAPQPSVTALFVDEPTSDETRSAPVAAPYRAKAETLPFMRQQHLLRPENATGRTEAMSAAAGPAWLTGSPSNPPSAPGSIPPQNVLHAAKSATPFQAPATSPAFGPPPARSFSQPAPAFAPPPPAHVQARPLVPPPGPSSPGTIAPVATRSAGGTAIPSAYAPAVARHSEPERVPAASHALAIGTEAASNAAADAESRSGPRTDPPPVAMPLGTPIDLLWFSVKSLNRARVFYKTLLAELEFEAFDSKHEIPSDDPEHDKGRHEIFGILAGEPAMDPAVAARVLSEAVDQRGRFTPPLAVFEAAMRPRFNEIARLKAAVSLAAASATVDKKMQELIDAANEQLGRTHPNAGGAAGRHLALIRDHFASQQGKAVSQAVSFDAEVDRLVLEERAFEERTILGDKHVVFSLGTGSSAVPAYCSAELRDIVPLLETFRARVIAEVHPRADLAETSSVALRVIALARTLDLNR